MNNIQAAAGDLEHFKYTMITLGKHLKIQNERKDSQQWTPKYQF